MDQRFEGTPKADLRLEGRTVVRSAVTNDWGSQLLWEIRKDGQVVGTAPARVSESYELTEKTPGQYDVVLRIFKYDGYAKDPAGKFTKSQFIDISDKVTISVG